jgi:hypothetical protein
MLCDHLTVSGALRSDRLRKGRSSSVPSHLLSGCENADGALAGSSSCRSFGIASRPFGERDYTAVCMNRVRGALARL